MASAMILQRAWVAALVMVAHGFGPLEVGLPFSPVCPDEGRAAKNAAAVE